MPPPGKLRLPALACSAAFLLCELVSRPWAEMGIADEWSYIRSAQLLAKTGHIVFVGWNAPIVGWQLYLGALFIKLFGFSFTAPRMGTLLIGVLTAYLMQRTLVRFGITEANAVLGTLTFVLSPLFMPLSATMMTDVPGFFSVLGCIYGCVHALRASRDRDAILWLGFAVAVNAICGTSRQIAWLGVLILVPSTLWLLRSRRTVLLYGLALTALGYIFVFATLHWFNAQPYAQYEPTPLPPIGLEAWKMIGHSYVRMALLIGLLLFPLSLPYVAIRGFSARTFAGMAGLVACSAALLYGLGGTPELRSLFYPFFVDWVGPHTVFESTILASSPPVVFGPLGLHLLSAIALIDLLSVGTVILVIRPRPINPASDDTLSWPQLLILFGPTTLFYFAVLSRRAIDAFHDRYLFVPLFITMVCVLLYSQKRLRTRWHTATGVAVAAIAFYGIISTHNTFALDRARVALSQEIFDSGVPPNQVDLGWEMNGWYELQVADYINNPYFFKPVGAFHLYPAPQQTGCHSTFLPYGFFPHLAPRYGISFDPNLCDGPAPFAPVSYSTWPLRKPTMLYVVKYPPPWESAIDIANRTPPSKDR